MEYGLHLERFGKAIAALRKGCRMSRGELARRAGLGLETLVSVENGQPDGIGLAEICRIAEALGVTPCDLMKRYERSVQGARWW
jgi:transcriptional regulator with XRE-family HTH domain